MKENQKWIWQQSDWPKFYYDINKLISDIEASSRLIGRLEVMCRSLNENDILEISENVLSEDAIETSAIEGEILKRISVRSSIRKKLGLSLKIDHSNIITDSLIEMLLDSRTNTQEYFTENILFSWHAALFPTGYSGLHKIRVGKYRGSEAMEIISGPVGKEKVHYIAPPEKRLDDEITLFLEWFNKDNDTVPIIKAGIAHFWLIMIHPFEDGNGRICRALVDYVLSKEYQSLINMISISKEISKDKKDYYNILEQMGKNNVDITNWLKWFIKIFLKALKETQWIVDQVFNKSIFWNKYKKVSLNDRQRKVLNRLLDSGDKFIGGLTTRKYSGICKCSKVTASRDLSDMEKKNILHKRPGSGRSTSYEISF